MHYEGMEQQMEAEGYAAEADANARAEYEYQMYIEQVKTLENEAEKRYNDGNLGAINHDVDLTILVRESYIRGYVAGWFKGQNDVKR